MVETKRGELIMRIRKVLLVMPLLVLGLAACGGESEGPTAAPATTVKVGRTDLGPVLTDQAGRVLYGFTRDKEKAAACDAGCVAVWPALAGKGTVAGDGAKAALLGEAPVGDATPQVTYNGWPLYYYVGDAVPGEANGAGVDGEWFPVAPDGSLIRKQS